ncbi:MAG: cupin domain-containing protein [Saprospiraceae bacterium]|nr:cupin domain-containing protein [Saprospiraceae bacterium]
MAKVIIEKLDEQQKQQRGIQSWPIWEKEISRFDWEYSGTEECLILEGEVDVETDEGKFSIKAGDFVTFKDGLKCVWDIKKDIRKHYNFK